MKNVIKLLMFTLTVGFMFTSCDMANQGAAAVDVKGKMASDGTRGVKMVDFQGAQVSLTAQDMLSLKAMNKAADDDAVSTVKGIAGNLTTAENIKQQLGVKFYMEDAPVEDGLFVFGIESEDAKKLTLEMYDEEGFAMAANNTISINSGNNYKALKVNDLESGTYFFKLKDDAGKELTRQVTIQNEK